MNKSVSKLIRLEKEASLVGSITSVLNWDQQTTMPPKGNDYRAEQLAYLAKIQHEKSTSQEFSDTLDKIASLRDTLTDRENRIYQAALRGYENSKKVPEELVVAFAKETTKGNYLWEQACSKNDESIFLPQLKKLIELSKERARCLGIDPSNPYNNLLSQFEWGTTTEELDKVFTELKTEIPQLVKKITEQGKFRDQLQGVPVSLHDQEEMGHACLKLMGFNKEVGVLETSSHPFSTTLGPQDFRITTRYDEKLFASSYLATAHEMGHSLYEQGLPKDLFGTSAGNACSFGFHESQSLFWEKKVSSSPEFLKLIWPFMAKPFEKTKPNLTLDELYHSVNHVKNSLIRVDADEVTYCLHIIIRYEMEKLLINEDLPVEEIRETWNKKYEDYLGITPPDHKSSFLQDVHWAWGAFGYFPSYALGHLISSQYEVKMAEDIGSVSELVSSERIPEITGWLRKNIHERASLYEPKELIKKVTGKGLSAEPFLNYLTKKYL